MNELHLWCFFCNLPWNPVTIPGKETKSLVVTHSFPLTHQFTEESLPMRLIFPGTSFLYNSPQKYFFMDFVINIHYTPA